MYSSSILFQTSAPWLLKTIEPLDTVLKHLSSTISAKENFNPIILDGLKMQTVSTFYDELIAGFGLPNYFGRNLNALSECLSDLEWLHGIGYIVLIQHAENILRLETLEKMTGFLDVLKAVGHEWSQTVSCGRPWNPSPIPFHSVFLCESPSWNKEIPLLTFA